MAPHRTIRIGLLICGFFQGAIAQAHGDYYDVYSNYLKSTMPSNCNTKVVIEGFHVRNMEFPNETQFDEFDLFMVTGSRKSFSPGRNLRLISPSSPWCIVDSAYDDNVPWIKNLVPFIRNLIENHPKVKLVGEFSLRSLGPLANRRTHTRHLLRTPDCLSCTWW